MTTHKNKPFVTFLADFPPNGITAYTIEINIFFASRVTASLKMWQRSTCISSIFLCGSEVGEVNCGSGKNSGRNGGLSVIDLKSSNEFHDHVKTSAWASTVLVQQLHYIIIKITYKSVYVMETN